MEMAPYCSLRFWKENWGLSIFLFETLASLLFVFLTDVRAHYYLFTEPGKYLWSLQDPYGLVLPKTNGGFFYSPGCGLFYFGLFALFPPRMGQSLYIGSSVAILLLGLFRLHRVLRDEIRFDLFKSPYRNIFFLMLGSELIGAIVAVKIDAFYVGLFLVFLSLTQTPSTQSVGLFLLAVAASWKLHPIATLALMLMPVVFERRLTPCFAVIAGLLFGWLSPLFVLPTSFFMDVTWHWLSVLQGYTSEAWRERIFQHQYGFLESAFRFDLGATWNNRISAIIGILFAAFYAWWLKRVKPSLLKAWLVALALGGAFVVLFSLLIQSNSYIIYIPLPLAIIILSNEVAVSRRMVWTCLIVTYVMISIAYSDLCPKALYRLLYDLRIKPVGVLIQLCLLISMVVRMALKEDPKESLWRT